MVPDTIDLDGKELRDRILRGGEESRSAFGDFWRVYYRRMMHFSRTFSGIPDSGREDAVAEMLIAAFSAIGNFKPELSLNAWVYGVARHKFLDAQRYHRRIERITVQLARSGTLEASEDAAAEIPVADDFPGRLETAETLELCARAIERLPALNRQIAILRFYEEMDATEIGHILLIPPSSVRWRVASIRKEIAAYVGGRR